MDATVSGSSTATAASSRSARWAARASAHTAGTEDNKNAAAARHRMNVPMLGRRETIATTLGGSPAAAAAATAAADEAVTGEDLAAAFAVVDARRAP